MKKKRLLKKLLIVLIIFILVLFMLNRKKNYSYKYKINGVNINQRYNKDKQYYKFILTYKNKTYKTIIYNDKYIKDKLIKKIEIEKIDDYTCLNITSDDLKINTMCSNKEGYYDYNYITNKEKQEQDYKTYNNINIYNTLNKTYLVWKYNSFEIINSTKNQTIDLFDNDVYEIPLTYLKDNYLIIANYNETYEYNSFIIYDIEKNKKKTLNLDNPISSNSYFMGDYDDSVYLYDIKNNQEYELVPYKNKIRKIKNKIIISDEWENISDTKLENNKPTFSYQKEVTYTLIDESLYKVIDSYQELIADNVKYIVKIDNNSVFYLKDDSLYHYDETSKETLIMTYFEWSFNYDNMIYIY